MCLIWTVIVICIGFPSSLGLIPLIFFNSDIRCKKNEHIESNLNFLKNQTSVSPSEWRGICENGFLAQPPTSASIFLFRHSLDFLLCIHLSPKSLLSPYALYRIYFFFLLPLLSLKVFLTSSHENFRLILCGSFFKCKDSKIWTGFLVPGFAARKRLKPLLSLTVTYILVFFKSSIFRSHLQV